MHARERADARTRNRALVVPEHHAATLGLSEETWRIDVVARSAPISDFPKRLERSRRVDAMAFNRSAITHEQKSRQYQTTRERVRLFAGLVRERAEEEKPSTIL